MQLLHKLHFIDIKPGKSGQFSHVLIWNPHWIIRWHQEQKTPGLVEANFNALLGRALDIGANDMLDTRCYSGRRCASYPGSGYTTDRLRHGPKSQDFRKRARFDVMGHM